MDHDPDMHDLARQIIRLDGAIKTSRAENDAMESRIEARLAGMEANMAHWKTDMAHWKTDMANWKTDMAQRDVDATNVAARRDADAAKRETRMLLAMAGMIGLAVTILGILITLPT